MTNIKYATNIYRLRIGWSDSRAYYNTCNTFRTKHRGFNKHPPHFQLIFDCSRYLKWTLANTVTTRLADTYNRSPLFQPLHYYTYYIVCIAG
jgi:hypothetical protein